MTAVVGNRWEQTLAYQLMADKLPPFEQNYRFHASRKFEIDIAWPDLKIWVEIQGGIFTHGAHGSPLGILRDMEKHNLLILAGWRVLECTPAEAKNGTALAAIKQLMGGES